MDDDSRSRFEQEVFPHLRSVYNTALRLARQEADARDLVQETLLRAVRTHDGFRPGTNARAWLFTILYSVFINRYRKAQRAPDLLSTEDLEARFHEELRQPGPPGVHASTAVEVERALAALPEAFRAAVVLVDLEELTYEEAAAVAECPVGTLKIAPVPGAPPAGRGVEDVCAAHRQRRRGFRSMTSPTGHPRDELQELADGRLDPHRRDEVEQHLASCQSCRAELARLETLRTLLRASFPERDLPPDLLAEASALLAAEPRQEAPRPAPVRTKPGRRTLVWTTLAAAAIVLLAVWVAHRPHSTLVTRVMASGRAWRAANTEPAYATTNAADLARYFNERLPFGVTVYDLGPMGYQLVGGRIEPLGDRQSAVFAYRTADGRRVVCHMFLGTMEELPAGAERRTNNGRTFLVYHQGADTVVFWPEHKVICAFVGDLSPDDVVRLAFAKASAI